MSCETIKTKDFKKKTPEQKNKHKIKHKFLKAGELVVDIYFQIIKQNFMFSPR